jgi:hypothetical protein
VAQLDAPTRLVRFLANQHTVLAVKPLRGLVGAALPLEALASWCEREAHTLWRRCFTTRHLLHQVSSQDRAGAMRGPWVQLRC